jgi:hypothetical protein
MMKILTTLGVLATSLLAAGGPALAGTAGANLKPPVEAKALERLVGEWRGTATFTMGERRDPAKMSVSCRPTAAAFGVSCQTRFEFAGGRVWEETDLFGWDAGARAYHWFAVTSTGCAHDHVAQPPQGDTWVFANSGLHEGKPMSEVIRLDRHLDGKLDFRTTSSVDGKPLLVLEGRLNKQ